jgi:hypothetical protein
MTPMSASQILDREFLELRAKLLELGASLDRLDRAEGSVANDPRRERLLRGLQLLLDDQGDRAERIQRLFSREYSPDWRSALNLPS